MSEIRVFLGEIADALKSFDDEKMAPTIKRGPNKGKSYPAGAVRTKSLTRFKPSRQGAAGPLTTSATLKAPATSTNTAFGPKSNSSDLLMRMAHAAENAQIPC